ncbi:MAG: hypothetical protein ABSB38_08600 [Dehalococcoidia bacterium]|jgi:hypothetical protein
MNRIVKNLSILVLVFGVIALAMGIVFVYQGVSKQALLTGIMKQENVKLSALGVTGDKANEIIDTAESAQIAGDTVRGHRHAIAPTYSDLLAGGKFDPTNPKDVTYAQALNLENYLYVGALSFGVTTIATAVGGFMIVVALALGAIGVVLLKVAKMLP